MLLTLRSAISHFVNGRIREDQAGGLRINVRANTDNKWEDAVAGWAPDKK
jgi:hypothetical protein